MLDRATSFGVVYSVEFGLDTPIPHPIHPKLKHQPRTLNPHIQRKIQIVKLHALRRRQSRKQAHRHSIQIGRKRAHIDQSLAERVGCSFGVACDEVVFDNERLTGSEVARVVEGYRG